MTPSYDIRMTDPAGAVTVVKEKLNHGQLETYIIMNTPGKVSSKVLPAIKQGELVNEEIQGWTIAVTLS